jgi:hypothetical protein
MLLTNQRLDKLAAMRIDFTHRGMLEGTYFANTLHEIGMSINWVGTFK